MGVGGGAESFVQGKPKRRGKCFDIVSPIVCKFSIGFSFIQVKKVKQVTLLMSGLRD